ncbi:MAG TPA: hypothetical protein VGS20_01125 [Candidatus Acidoferrales bacterium]|nr:hypothetical protein [Candidatus Acidoferrales bacterium]
MTARNHHYRLLSVALPQILVLIGLLLAAGAAVARQNPAWPQARPEDVRSVDAVIRATYESVSDTTGHGRDPDRLRSLFIPQAQMIDVTYREGKPAVTVRSIAEFARLAASRPAGTKRYEREVARRTETYGNLVQVWSSNEYGAPGAAKPAGHGINAITLTYDGTRWWIIAIEWKNETPGQAVPAKYLPAKRPARR